MIRGQVIPVLSFIRRLGDNAWAVDQTDEQLLQRFVAQRDDAAFAALVQRHGPMVLAVCQRLLCDTHQAEDAFQVTFLVLARKTSSLGRSDLLGNWLHSVAYRTALKARAQATRWKTMDR